MAWTSALARRTPPRPRPSGGYTLVSASRGSTPAPGYGNVIPPTPRPPEPPAGMFEPFDWGIMPGPGGLWSWEQPSGDGGGPSGPGGPGGYSIDADPGYQAALAAEREGQASIAAALKAARERGVIEFGDPNIVSAAGFAVDPSIAEAARQNYLAGNATLARLDKARDDRRMQMINTLAGRGIIFSGETGYQEGEGGRIYGNSIYDARNKALDYFRQAQESANQQRNALRQAVIQAMQNAVSNAIAGGYGGGYGGGSGGGSGGGGLENPNQFGNGDEIGSAAAAYAAAHPGYKPGMVMQEGVHTENGQRGVWIKFRTPTGDSTEWVPLGSAPSGGGNAPTGGGAAAPAPPTVDPRTGWALDPFGFPDIGKLLGGS